jgi:hypothetical protein
MSTLLKTSRGSTKSLELRIIQSYVLVLREPTNANGYRSFTLERHGPYEIRLVESPAHIDIIPFWVELFDNHSKMAIDSFGTGDVEAAVHAVEAFIERAQHLHQA